MKTLDALLAINSDDHDLLCKRIEKLAAITLGKLGIKKYYTNYEDYMQTAYEHYFTILPTFDPNKGKLEGYFMFTYRRHIIKMLKEQYARREIPSGKDSSCTDNPLMKVIISDLDCKLQAILTDEERNLYNSYLKKGITNLEEIAEAEDTSINEVKWAIDSVRGKAREIGVV